MDRRSMLTGELQAARRYGLALLDSIPQARWFERGPAGVSHVAWQAGHLALAEYRLGVQRLADGLDLPESSALPDAYLEWFGRGSAVFEAGAYPTPSQILAVMEAVHQAALQRLAALPATEFDAPVLVPHPQFDTKAGAVAWAARHEMLHAGQIGLLRRELGYDPMW